MACTTAFSQEKTAKDKKEKETVTFYVSNIGCENCIKKIEKNISFEKGVIDMKCDLDTKTVQITYRKDKTDTDKLIQAFEKIDYNAVVAPEPEKK